MTRHNLNITEQIRSLTITWNMSYPEFERWNFVALTWVVNNQSGNACAMSESYLELLGLTIVEANCLLVNNFLSVMWKDMSQENPKKSNLHNAYASHYINSSNNQHQHDTRGAHVADVYIYKRPRSKPLRALAMNPNRLQLNLMFSYHFSRL